MCWKSRGGTCPSAPCLATPLCACNIAVAYVAIRPATYYVAAMWVPRFIATALLVSELYAKKTRFRAHSVAVAKLKACGSSSADLKYFFGQSDLEKQWIRNLCYFPSNKLRHRTQKERRKKEFARICEIDEVCRPHEPNSWSQPASTCLELYDHLSTSKVATITAVTYYQTFVLQHSTRLCNKSWPLF
jgi:hypothetical protein